MIVSPSSYCFAQLSLPFWAGRFQRDETQPETRFVARLPRDRPEKFEIRPLGRAILLVFGFNNFKPSAPHSSFSSLFLS